MTFRPDSVLFDKGVIGRVYERRLRLALGRPPTMLQAEAAAAYERMCSLTARRYITTKTENILRLRAFIFAASLLADTLALKKGRYLRRWARRLRDMTFSPEDAIIISYGSFGIDLKTQSVGADVILTTDLKLATNYQAEEALA